MKKLLLSALLITSLSAQAALFGPSGSDNDCTSRASFAWCLMDLAKKSDGLDDAKPGTMPVGYSAPGAVSKVVDGVGIGSQVAIGVSDIAKVSNYSLLGGFGGAMNLLAAAKDLGRSDPASQYHSVAIMDQSVADPLSAIITPMVGALKQLTEAENAEMLSDTPSPFKGKVRIGKFFKLTGGPLCSNRVCVIAVMIDGYACKIDNATLPIWLGESKPVKVVRCNSGILHLAIDGEAIDRQTVIYGASKYMPDSVFIYLPPTTVKPIATVVTKDKEFFFIRPERKE